MRSQPSGPRAARPSPPKGAPARSVALEALARVEQGGYANLVLPEVLDRSGLDERDRAFVTELVYGVTRWRRRLDHRIDAFARGPVDADTRSVLRMGAYQLLGLGTPAHAAVSTSTELAPPRSRAFVNAVLRRIVRDDDIAAAGGRRPEPLDGRSGGDDGDAEPLGVRLSYPDWIVERLLADLGPERGLAALEAMNEAPTVSRRSDGYVQDRASQWVAAAVGARPGEVVLDVASAPGGKATAMAEAGAFVVAADIRQHRCMLTAHNTERLGLRRAVSVVQADGTSPPYRAESFDRVLVDAPCSGLGVLHRRPDARWRIQPDDVVALVELQRRLLAASIPLVRPGGVLVYSVCTLTDAETTGIDDWLAGTAPHLVPLEPLGGRWEPVGRGSRLLPQTAGTDGMTVYRYRVADATRSLLPRLAESGA